MTIMTIGTAMFMAKNLVINLIKNLAKRNRKKQETLQ